MNRAIKIYLPTVIAGLIALVLLWKLNYESVAERDSERREVSSQNAPRSGAKLSASMNSQPAFADLQSRTMVGEKAFVLTQSHIPLKGDAIAVIEALAPAANSGDSRAAFDIYLKVSACRRALNSRTSDAELAAYMKAGIAQSALTTEEKTLAECAELDFENKLVSQNWLEKAALNGSIEAKILYATDSTASLGTSADMLKDPQKLAQYKENAVRFLNDAANSGSVDALMSLANAYDAGILVPKSPSSSYAYYLAIQKASPGLIPQAMLDGMGSQMSSRDINYAKARAQQIYSGCCLK